MEIIRHYACFASDELSSFLNQNQIPCQQDSLASLRSRVYFDISESDPVFSQLAQIPLPDCIITKRVKYTKQEIFNAPWLTCNPTTAKINLVNENISFLVSEQYDKGKAHHRKLSGKPFYVVKPINHNANQHFFTAYEATNQMFCTEHAKSLIQKENLPLSFNAVRNIKTDLPIGNLYDIRINYVLPTESLDLSNVEETFICPVCGAKTFLPPISLRIHADYLSLAPDVCRTAAVFGWGGNYAAPINIISHDVYVFLEKNHLTRGLQFDPIALVE